VPPDLYRLGAQNTAFPRSATAESERSVPGGFQVPHANAPARPLEARVEAFGHERWTSVVDGLGVLDRVAAAGALVRLEDLLADADGVRSDLDELVGVDPFHGRFDG